MALLGSQLVVTLVMISVIQKLGPHFSFAKWLICSTGLVRYLYPTDNELKQLANFPKDKQKPRKTNSARSNHNNGKSAETFHVPRSLDIELKPATISPLDVVHLRYYPEYQWLVDFALYASVVYALTEIYQLFYSLKDEVNLSMMWCGLVVVFTLKLLLSLTVQYFKADESVGERSTCLVMGFVYLVIAMIILIVDENTLELGLENAYTSFNDSASVFLSKQGLGSSGPASKIIIKFCLALWGGLLGAVFTFPGLRIARMHWDLLKYYKDNKLIQTLLNLSFALPFLLIIAWIKPISRDYLTARVFSGMNEPLQVLSERAFESLRLMAIVGTMCLKLTLMPLYLQAYLDMAYHRIQEQKKEAGRITNVDLQKKIAAVFYYLCVVSLQYVAPVILCVYLTLMYKSLGGYSWALTGELTVETERVVMPTVDDKLNLDGTPESITESAQQFHLALESLKSVFSSQVYRGLFGFFTWWCCFLYFATTSVGMIYQSYFTQL